MTDERLAELETLGDACERSPLWTTDDPFALRNTRIWSGPGAVDCICTMQLSNCPGWKRDRDRIVAAHAAVPELIAEVRRLRALTR